MNAQRKKLVQIDSECLNYLDDLKASGVTDMFGAARAMQVLFNLTRQEAVDVIAFWSSLENGHKRAGLLTLVITAKQPTLNFVNGEIK